ncbi:MAG: type 1 glutamine amidotransferase, partial [Chitinophagaceae bacterium]
MKIHIIQHVPFESPGSILEWAKKREATVQYTNVFNGDFYPGDIDFDLLVVMGGPMGANDDEQLSWITDEKKFIGKTLSSGRKILGICLGSQLLAAVLNAGVYVNKEKEIGWWPVQTNKEADHALLNSWPAEWT